MKPYGVPRTPNVVRPDIADIRLYGLADEYYDFKNKDKKANTRRIWKKRARTEGKRQCEENE